MKSGAGFFGALAGALVVAAAFEADHRLGGALLLLVVLAMLISANRRGIFPLNTSGAN